MKKPFGTLPSGAQAYLYTIRDGSLTATVSDFGASLVSLWVPDREGAVADVVLGYDDCLGYLQGDACLGATVGRNANRIQGAAFELNGVVCKMIPNEGENNLHSGPDHFYKRLWEVTAHTENSISLHLFSPHGDQGFPGNADITVTYTLKNNSLQICYQGLCDRDTVFNMTNHSYFNLAGQECTDKALDQVLTLPGRFFNPDHADSIPTGELRPVEDTPMDFRHPKAIGRDIHMTYDALELQGGFDHNWEVFCNPCAVLADPESGRTMTVETDCPGVQFYSGNYLEEVGKGGVHYCKRSGICLETQFYPDSVHHPQWPQPITKAGEPYYSETTFKFFWQ